MSIAHGGYNYSHSNISQFKDGKYQAAIDKRKAWDQDGDNDKTQKGDNDLTNDGWKALAKNFDAIDGTDGGAKKDNAINADDLFNAVKDGKLKKDPAAERAAILLMTNSDLLKKLDGKDSNGLISKQDMESKVKGLDASKDEKNDFHANIKRINNDPSRTFMDKFESAIKGDDIKGGGATNGKSGDLGMLGLSKLKDHEKLLNPMLSESDMNKELDKFLDDPEMKANVGKDKDAVKGKLKTIITDFRDSGSAGEPLGWSKAAANAKKAMDGNDGLHKDLYGDDGAASKKDFNSND